MKRLLLMVVVLLLSVYAGVSAQGNAEGGLQIVLAVDSDTEFTLEDLQAASVTLLQRLTALGVDDVSVRLINDTKIQVQVPGTANQQQVMEAVTQPGLLEFVDFTGMRAQIMELTGQTIFTSEQAAQGIEDEGRLLNPQNNTPFETILTGDAMIDSEVLLDTNTQQWTIAFELSDEGAAIFEPYTQAHIGESLAIVLDGEVISAPVINAPLSKNGIIVGNFTQEEAALLATQLRFGALKLPLIVESVDTFRSVSLPEATETP